MDLGAEVDRLQRHQKQAGIEDVPLRNVVVDPLMDTLRRTRKRLAGKSHKRREPLFFLLWAIWLFVGTMFYAFAERSNLGIVRGFYMAINIGYSIGFGFPGEEKGNYLYFSSIYVLLGASFVGVALGFFADKITQDNQEWFTKLQQEKQIEEAIRAKGTNLQGNIQAWIFHNSSALKAVSSWLTIVIIMITYSMIVVKWTFGEAQYFAISTLSTGGHWPIPAESPTWLFGLTALFTMVGVPVMAVAMAEIAQGLISKGDLDEAKETIDAVVTKEELEFLQEIGLEDMDGLVDKAEFIILCMVRMGNDPGLIKYITQRFAELNFYTGEALTVAEITQGACKFHGGKIRRAQSIAGVKTLNTVSEHDYVVPEASKSYLDYYHSKMDDSAGSYGGRQRTRHLPALAAVPENMSQSQHQKGSSNSTQEGPANSTQSAKQAMQSSVSSSVRSSILRNRSLELSEVFKSDGSHLDVSGYSSLAAQSGKRIPRKERRDTSAPSLGFDESKGEAVPNQLTPMTANQLIPMSEAQDTTDDIDTSLESSGYSFATSSRRNSKLVNAGEPESENRAALTDVIEESSDTDLSEMEEGKLHHKDPVRESLNQEDEIPADEGAKSDPSMQSDVFLDELEEGRLDNDDKPNRFKRFYDDLKQESSAPSNSNTAYAADFSSAATDDRAENPNDGRDDDLTPAKMNYAAFLFSRENGIRELKTRQPTVNVSREDGSRGLKVRRSTRAMIPQHLPGGRDLIQNGHLHEQCPSQGSSSSGDSSEEDDFLPSLPKKSFSSYLMRGD